MNIYTIESEQYCVHEGKLYLMTEVDGAAPIPAIGGGKTAKVSEGRGKCFCGRPAGHTGRHIGKSKKARG